MQHTPLLLRSQAQHVARNRLWLRTFRLMHNLLNVSAFYWAFRHVAEVIRVWLAAQDHPLFHWSVLYRNRIYLNYSAVLDWCFHLFYLYFTIIQLAIMLCPPCEMWLEHSNYLLLDIIDDYNRFSREVDQHGPRGQSRLLSWRQAKDWEQVKKQYAWLIELLKRTIPQHYSDSKVTRFALQLQLRHTPNAPFKSKLQMMMIYAEAELVNAWLMAAQTFTLTIVFTVIYVIQTLFVQRDFILTPWLLLFWALELVVFLLDTTVMCRIGYYMLYGSLLLAFTVHANLVAHNRLLRLLTKQAQAKSSLILISGINLYRTELYRTLNLLTKADLSIFGRYFFLLMLAINVPVNILVLNMTLWEAKDPFQQFVFSLYLLAQSLALFAAFNLFASLSASIHSTGPCFVPLQRCLVGRSTLRAKLMVMMLHELIVTDRVASMSMAGMAPVTRQNMFHFLFIYMAYFLTVMKFFI